VTGGEDSNVETGRSRKEARKGFVLTGGRQ
jgi:hypothetical protein